MFICKIENNKNQTLTLTQNESQFQVIKIIGLDPPDAQINTSKIAGLDGSRYNSGYLNDREIVITVKIRGDIETNRLLLYSFFKPNKLCKFYYKNRSRDVYIEGYTRKPECDIFTNNEIMQISILCPNPYFKGVNEIVDDISKSLAAFSFPFAISSSGRAFSTIDTSRITNVYNDSESDTGVIIEIDLLNSANKIQINNITNGGVFILNYNFIENDKVIIDTNKGNKSIKLIRNGTEYNLFTSMTNNSTFFQLTAGDNFFSYLVDNGNNDDAIHIVFKHYTLYGGV